MEHTYNPIIILIEFHFCFQIYVKNFTLAIQHEFAPYGISVQLVTPLFVRTKMNSYSTTVMNGSILFPDVETYTKSAVYSLGKTNETTGYWIHGIQVCITHFVFFLLQNLHLNCYYHHLNLVCFFRTQYALVKLSPTWFRTIVGAKMNIKFRGEYFAQQQAQECK